MEQADQADQGKLITVRVSQEEFERLKWLAKQMRTTRSGVIRAFLNQARQATPGTVSVWDLNNEPETGKLL